MVVEIEIWKWRRILKTWVGQRNEVLRGEVEEIKLLEKVLKRKRINCLMLDMMEEIVERAA